MNAVYTYDAAHKFEQLYTRLRKREGRMYSDQQVAALPEIDKTHPYCKEWQIRTESLHKLLAYLKRRGDEQEILEVGCGNGWLSAQLAAITRGNVTGIDINGTELEQAKRVFDHIPNLDFKQCTLWDAELQEKNFDVIIFAASVQYFCSLKKIITEAMDCLTLQGEIHIIGSHFYKQNQIPAARQRTKNYFTAAGFEEMTDFYFHHSIEDVKKFNCTFLYNPASLYNRFNKSKDPFYHVVIKNRYQ